MSVVGVVCFFLALLHVGWGQAPPLPTSAPQFDPNCGDLLDNCEAFGADHSTWCGGQYEDWARDNCNQTCGYCVGPATSPPPCVDVLQNCDSYNPSTCTDPLYVGWARDNCRYTCRLCTSGFPYTTSTIAPENCVDKLDCRLYSKSSCTGDFLQWAQDNCPVYCGLCPGASTTAPPCIDHVPNCGNYEDTMCTSDNFRIWAEDNCRKFCNFCTGGPGTPAAAATTAGVHPPIMTPPPLKTSPPFLTPPPLPNGK